MIGLASPAFLLFLLHALLVPSADSAPENLSTGRFNSLGADPEMAVEVGNRAGLAEMLDAERHGAMTQHTAEPTQGRRMSINGCYQPGAMRDVFQQGLDVTNGLEVTMQPGALRGLPAGIESIRRGDGEHGYIPPVAADARGCRDGFTG